MDTTLTPDLLLQAYMSGVFPMAEHKDDPEVFWVDPRKRGILPLDSFHLSRSLAKRIRQMPYEVRLNTDFAQVVTGCAERPETWINTTIFDLYTALHSRGFAHSLEIWDADALIGGVYGVAIGRAFFGESMFSRRTDASKIALAFLTTHLVRQRFSLFDTQFITPHLATLGAEEISRARYHKMLDKAIRAGDAQITNPLPTVQEVLQRNIQIS